MSDDTTKQNFLMATLAEVLQQMTSCFPTAEQNEHLY